MNQTTLDRPGAQPAEASRAEMSWEEIRQDFPVLDQRVGDLPLAYLDNAASSQMPQPVIDRLVEYQTREHANVHRGVHMLSQRATDAFDQAREKVRRFINAPSAEECIFARGATEAINLVAYGWGRKFVQEGDEIIVSQLEHHSNIVPWQILCQEKGARLRVLEMTDEGSLKFEQLDELLNERTKLVAVNHVSNALGTINPVAQIVKKAHAHGAVVMVDGCQATPHLKVDVQALGADFYAFSGHKMLAPTGVGVLFGKRALLEEMNPFLGGGDMILNVSFEETTYAEIPYKFEAGTPPIMPVIGLGAAIDYLESVGMERIARREHELLEYATARLSELESVRIIGTAPKKASVLSFEIKDVHPHDVGTILDTEGVAIRAGHHCAQPIMTRLGVPATARASFAFYNNRDDIDALVRAIGTVEEIFH